MNTMNVYLNSDPTTACIIFIPFIFIIIPSVVIDIIGLVPSVSKDTYNHLNSASKAGVIYRDFNEDTEEAELCRMSSESMESIEQIFEDPRTSHEF